MAVQCRSSLAESTQSAQAADLDPGFPLDSLPVPTMRPKLQTVLPCCEKSSPQSLTRQRSSRVSLMNWKHLTIQVLAAASAALRLSTGYGQNCCCCRQINAQDQTTSEIQSTDPSRFQPLSPNNGIFSNSRGTTGVEGSSSVPEPDLRTFSSDSSNQPVPGRGAIAGGSSGSGSGSGPAPSGGPIPGTTSRTPGAGPVPGARPSPGIGPGSGGGPGTPPAATQNDESSRVPAEVPQTDQATDDSSSLLVTVNPPNEQLPDPVPDLPDTPSDPPICVTPPPTNSPEDTPVVPEPGSLLLLSLGTSLGSMMWLRRTNSHNVLQPKP